jgi:hypothetical protein
MAERRVVAYAADTMNSLKTLEFTCERDEARLTSRIVALDLGTLDNTTGKKVTAATYEEDEETQVGHLIFEQYQTEVEVSRLELLHKSLGEPVRGQAYVNNQVIKVLIFREEEQ